MYKVKASVPAPSLFPSSTQLNYHRITAPSNMASLPVTAHRPIGSWLPEQRPAIQDWIASKLQQTKRKNFASLDPNPQIVAFQKLVNDNPNLKTLANDMFTQSSKHYDPTGEPALKTFGQFIDVLSLIIQSAPPFFDKQDPPTAMGMIGFPINAVLDWPMGTVAGYEFWLLPEVNASFKGVLDTWGSFLASPGSQSGLEGWLSKDALHMLATVANTGDLGGPTFDKIFICNPTEKYYGYKSWDDFFIREFQDGMRPIACPDDAPPTPEYPDPTLVITNACESAPLQVAEHVKLHDQFWLKSQPYSLDRMLNSNPNTSKLVGGTVYQAFLSAKSYHRWHAPVSGNVIDIELVPGSYYSENYFEGLAGNPDDPDPAAPNYSQPYISAVAARGIIWIQADNPTIGLMAIVFIGMAEVSGCEFIVQKGDHITKGQQIGMFHFGGSSHCMIFQPGVKLLWKRPPPYDMDTENNSRVNSLLAVVGN
ncbi:phosphatidylserine decarboxylase 2 [Fusarium pseudocircinatum]|uniref:Phosphatidylserine decarboxylase 2 n=1 Tax=Fusarium pseudocircinatum TaxID=56676 RepID=A0A8H5PTC6_9HYPO|nr:phosphatidylserine decarboxylase 2 [Fusarium pseudocircinatum]